jgi:hypothetical protein
MTQEIEMQRIIEGAKELAKNNELTKWHARQVADLLEKNMMSADEPKKAWGIYATLFRNFANSGNFTEDCGLMKLKFAKTMNVASAVIESRFEK